MASLGLMGLFPFAFYYLYLIVPLAPVAYLFIKWRAYRDNSPMDPHLGMKVVLHYFKTLAHHVMLISLALVLTGLLKWEYKGETKIGLAMFISAIIICLPHRLILEKISKTGMTNFVIRFYDGFNLIVIGLLGMASLVVTLVMVFQWDFKNIKLPVSGLVVYGAAWAFRTLKLIRDSKGQI